MNIFRQSFISRQRCIYSHGSAFIRQFNCSSSLQQQLNNTEDAEFDKAEVPDDFRSVYPEFLPDPTIKYRNKLKEKLERSDMLSRRSAINIPEFYVGTIMAVTVADINASEKTNKFVGICIDRGSHGLRAWFILRNVIDNLGIEIKYDLYSPLVQDVEVLILQKRLDDTLYYLRDALPEFSTFPEDLHPEMLPDGEPVPIDETKVKLKPRPWHERWERQNLRGVQDLGLPAKFYRRAKDFETPWLKYDLVQEYRDTIPEEEQAKIFRSMSDQYPKLESARRKIKRIED